MKKPNLFERRISRRIPNILIRRSRDMRRESTKTKISGKETNSHSSTLSGGLGATLLKSESPILKYYWHFWRILRTCTMDMDKMTRRHVEKLLGRVRASLNSLIALSTICISSVLRSGRYVLIPHTHAHILPTTSPQQAHSTLADRLSDSRFELNSRGWGRSFCGQMKG